MMRVAAVLITMLSGCSLPCPVPNDLEYSGDLDGATRLGRFDGFDRRFFLFGAFPVYSIETRMHGAIDDALEKSGGDAATSIDAHVVMLPLPIPLLLMMDTVYVRADVWKLERKE